MQLANPAPRYVTPKTDLRVGVAPWGDRRDHEASDRSSWYFFPLIPWSTAVYDRSDEEYADSDEPEHFSRQAARLFAEHLAASGLFAEVRYLEDPEDRREELDLLVTGELQSSRREELRTLYGLSVLGLALWLGGAPTGWDEVHWELAAAVTDPSGSRIYKKLELEQASRRWTGLYWGADGFPDDEAILLQRMFANLTTQLDHALSDVPELAAMAVRTIGATTPQAERAAPEKASIASMIVMEDARDPLRAAFLELFVAELQGRCTGKVLTLAEVNTMLAAERMRDMLGCTDVACISEIGGALDADAIVAISREEAGGQQTLTVKLIDPRDQLVLSRTVWSAPGADPSAFVERMPDIAEAAIAPLMPWSKATSR